MMVYNRNCVYTRGIGCSIRDGNNLVGLFETSTKVGETTMFVIFGPSKSDPELFVTVTALELEPTKSLLNPLTSLVLILFIPYIPGMCCGDERHGS